MRRRVKPPVVILAAGASARLGECKALVDLGGQSALARLITQAALGGADDIFVIAGRHHDEIALELARVDRGRRAQLLFNAFWSSGRTGSVAIAAARLPDRGLVIAPIDVPLVQSDVFRSLFQAWEEADDPPRGWLAPRVEPGARHGHPLILGRDLAREILRMDPSAPLRQARALADPLWDVRVADPAILDELDTPSDLAKLRERLKMA